MPATRPRRAILLAAGFGSRMGPLSHDLPKPAMPLWGRPLLAHAMHLLADSGVTDFLINLHHLPGEVIAAATAHQPPGTTLTFSYEPHILGTGGALRRAHGFIEETEPFWLMNTDIAAVVDLATIARALTPRAIASLWMTSLAGPRTVEIVDDTVRNFRSATPGQPNTATFCGLQLVRPALLDYLPPTPFCSVVEAYEAARADGYEIRASEPAASYWADLGTPERYLSVHGEIWRQAHQRPRGPAAALLGTTPRRRIAAARRRGVHIDGFAAIGASVDLANGARLHNCVLWDGARIAKTTLAQAIVARHTTVHKPATNLLLPLTTAANPQLEQAARLLHWHGEVTIEVLPGRGSDRAFYRLSHGRTSAIAVIHGDARPENRRYATCTRVLTAQGVRVPAILHHAPRARLLVMQDAGRLSLLDRLETGTTRARRLQLYTRALGEVAKLHATPLTSALKRQLEPVMGPRLLRWEHALFIEHMSPRLALTRPQQEALTHELATLARRLAPSPHGLIHRDLQSSNLMLQRQHVILIDYQGMRRGPLLYDVASLLCDPYVELAQSEQEELLAIYCQLSGQRATAALREQFWIAACQRLVQALGAFGRLSALPPTRRFAAHIAPAARMLLRAIAATPLALPLLQAQAEQLARDPRH